MYRCFRIKTFMNILGVYKIKNLIQNRAILIMILQRNKIRFIIDENKERINIEVYFKEYKA